MAVRCVIKALLVYDIMVFLGFEEVKKRIFNVISRNFDKEE